MHSSKLGPSASLIPFVLALGVGFSLSHSGCWNFETLTDKSVTATGDGGSTVDMYYCATQKNSLIENCTNGIDDNDDCLVDCADPECASALVCMGQQNQFIGYGSRKNPKGSTCSNGQSPTNLKQGLTLTADCSSGCGCMANTNNAWQCTSKVHWYSSQNNCNNNTEIGNTALQTATPADCGAINGAANNSYFKLDNVTSVCPIDNSKMGTLQSSWADEEVFCGQNTGCQDFDCMLGAGATCIAYKGVLTKCPSQFPVLISNWFESVTDGRTCTCQCGAASGSCAISGTQAQLNDQSTCMGGKNQAITQSNTCVQANLGGGATPAGLSFQPVPMCTASGTAPTDLNAAMAAGQVTLNSPVSTCCTM